MESGRYAGEGDFNIGAGTRDSYSELVARALAEEGLKELAKILEARPELQQFVTQTTRTRAMQALQGLGKTLKKYPQLLQELEQMAEVHPHEVVMAILPGENLVFTHTAKGIEGFAPVLACTHLAMDDVSNAMRTRGTPYEFVTSSNDLIPYVLDRLKREERPVISYLRDQMDPRDYIALGAQRVFANETFRFSIVEGRIER